MIRTPAARDAAAAWLLRRSGATGHTLRLEKKGLEGEGIPGRLAAMLAQSV
eukprot:gene39075-59118_t